MRLSGIKVAGFKSFVDATSLPLGSARTGVVGPNGCGKSNIIDAVRWVLGETSIKNLRGSETEDVIFNGSRTRKPAGRASVELLFDNSDFQIAGPFAAYAEIAVRRELTRDGGSQYYLNGRKCLKRDVTDLFLGTGLGGKNQYAIIEQGMVSRMVEAKPEELRQWLEEAAGISRYRERRRETESRIRQTRENLSRLSDLQSELTARIEVLAKQAANAEKYKQFKQEERQLRAELLLLRLRALEAQATAHEAAIASSDEAFAACRSALAAAESGRTGAEEALRAAGAGVNAEQARAYEAEAAVARHEQTLNHTREMKNLRLRELAQLESQLAELRRRNQSETQRRDALAQNVAAAQSRIAEAESREAAALDAMAAAEQGLADEQQRWEEFSQRSQQPMLEAEGERVRVQGLERAHGQAEERHRRLQTERSSLDAAPIQASLFAVDNELGTLEQELAEAQERLQSADRELQGLREQRSTTEGALHESRQALQSARGRLASLETLQQAALREDDAELGNWLRGHGWAQLPRLAVALQVEAGWETAVEHVLSGLLQAPVLPSWDALREGQPAAPRAGATLLHEVAGEPAAPGTLAEKASGPAAVMDWLSHIQVAASTAEAAQRAATLLPGESVITTDGVWRGRSWIRYPRLHPEQSGVIARALLIKQLRGQVEQHTQAVQQRVQELGGLRNRQTQLENDRRGLSGRFDQMRARQAQRLAERRAQAVRLEQTEARVRGLEQELEALAAQRIQQQTELSQARERLAQLQQIAQRLQGERAERNQALGRAREVLQAARAAAQTAAQQRGQAQVQHATQSSALAGLEQALLALGEQATAVQSQHSARQAAGEELDAPIAAQVAELETVRAALQEQRERLRGARGALGAAEDALAAAVRTLHAAEAAKEAAQEHLQQQRLEYENLRARREGAEAQFAETGFGRAELSPQLDEQATPQAWEDKVAQIGRRIDRLGAINLAAIQELDEARAREAYLQSQHADVAQALATLEDAMLKLDRETQDRFKSTFDQVNNVFKARFPQLFGGGEAYLELTGDNLLETGVRVMARPPGKRNSSIQMLSGGEKAMVAVSLLLALFQLNPAPFCLMDEVDAPMDDANVGRFCEVVREMSQNVQFIIITHNKITMELAEQLHGVTMQEPGVSRLVSVDVQQAVQLAGQQEKPERLEAQA